MNDSISQKRIAKLEVLIDASPCNFGQRIRCSFRGFPCVRGRVCASIANRFILDSELVGSDFE